ncbi:MAG: iron ABC transporter permease [Candidatus Omnitrophota bacterium]
MALKRYQADLKVKRLKIAGLGVFLLLSLAGSFFLGPVSWRDAAGEREILFLIRLPRLVLASLVGSALAASGMGLQALFRNPLASPYILGISSASAFGACLAMLFGLPVIPGAFAFGLATTFLLYFFAEKSSHASGQGLILLGIAAGAFFSALVSLLIFISGEKLHQIVFWLMGGFWTAEWRKVIYASAWIIPALFAIFFFPVDLNVVSTGEETALDLGVEVSRVKKIVLVSASLLVAAAVSVSGTIGFIGLVVPHLARIWLGSDHRFLLPGSVLAGAVLLLWADNLSRCISFTGEIPVGIFTSLLGVPFFLYLLFKR